MYYVIFFHRIYPYVSPFEANSCSSGFASSFSYLLSLWLLLGRVCCLKLFETAGEPISMPLSCDSFHILSIHLNPFALNAHIHARNSHAFESFPHFHPWIAPHFGAITILVGLIPCILRICPCSARLHLSLANHHEIPNSGHFHGKNGLWLETNAQEVQQNRKTISKPDIMSGSYGPYGNGYVTWKGRGWWSQLMRCDQSVIKPSPVH